MAGMIFSSRIRECVKNITLFSVSQLNLPFELSFFPNGRKSLVILGILGLNLVTLGLLFPSTPQSGGWWLNSGLAFLNVISPGRAAWFPVPVHRGVSGL